MKQHVEQLQKLWQLQELEQKILHQEQGLQNIASTKEYQQKKQDYQASQENLKKEEAELAAAKKKQRRKELELQTTVDLLAKLQQKLYSGEINNVRELEGLEKKAQVKQIEKSKLEDDILFLMESIEGEEQEVLTLQKLQKKEHEKLQRLKAKAQKDTVKAQGKLHGLNGRREDLRQEIDGALLKKYTEMSRRGGALCFPCAAGALRYLQRIFAFFLPGAYAHARAVCFL
jgi:predicted  nucleic acid-binding Zn-ribbon protein